MVSANPGGDHGDVVRAWHALSGVPDPEIPSVSIVDLGMVRDVRIAGGRLEVAITPTYSGCPATEMILRDVRSALAAIDLDGADVQLVLSPPWSTDSITDAGREKLSAAGIAPPAGNARAAAEVRPLRFVAPQPRCPLCGARETERLATFGSTACKALYRCLACREPFDYFKPY
jgi:ring-1,2-phenylacetyl-CoA epoxidase subunit PaaD